jgi:hypothetical protein
MAGATAKHYLLLGRDNHTMLQSNCIFVQILKKCFRIRFLKVKDEKCASVRYLKFAEQGG